jgi:PIN domain nuclease of toxin-antitoxin system
MSAVVLDTHAAVWYFLGSARLSATALTAIETAINDGEPVYLPSISIIEVIYLVEKGRLPETAL